MIKSLKICGVSDPKTLNYILDHRHKPSMIGFITNYERSRRFIEYDKLQRLINIDKKDVNFVSVWLLLSGQVRTIEVHAQAHGVDDQQLAGDYIQDRRFRKRFTAWMKSLWEKKDALLIQSLMRFRSGKVSPVSH